MKKILLFFLLLFIPLLTSGCGIKKDNWTGFFYSEGCEKCQAVVLIKKNLNSLDECYKFGLEKYRDLNRDFIDPPAVKCGKNCKQDKNGDHNCDEYIFKESAELLSEADNPEDYLPKPINSFDFQENREYAEKVRAGLALPKSYKIENNKVYRYEKIINKADPETFEAFEFSGYSKDKNYVFYQENLIKGADPQSFEALDGGYARDYTSVYHVGNKLDWLDSKTFSVYSDKSEYTKDKNGVYYFQKKIEGADPESFEALGNTMGDMYTKDKNNVYCLYNKIVLGADPETFEFLPSTYAGKDKEHVFVGCDTLEGADPQTFEKVNYNYFKDEKHVWKVDIFLESSESIELVKGADPASFNFEQ